MEIHRGHGEEIAGHDQERQPRPVATAALVAAQARRSRATLPVAGQRVGAGLRRVDDGRHDVIVAAIRVVVDDDDRRLLPGREALESSPPPCWNPPALRNDTAGRLPRFAAAQKSSRSYWWLAWSSWPIASTDGGGKWCGVAVDR